jgi:hypothetical protein
MVIAMVRLARDSADVVAGERRPEMHAHTAVTPGVAILMWFRQCRTRWLAAVSVALAMVLVAALVLFPPDYRNRIQPGFTQSVEEPRLCSRAQYVGMFRTAHGGFAGRTSGTSLPLTSLPVEAGGPCDGRDALCAAWRAG